MGGGDGAGLQLYQGGLFLQKMLIESEWRAFASRMTILARVCLFPRGRFATMIYAPIFEVFLPLCLCLGAPKGWFNWVMPKLTAYVFYCRAGDQVVRWKGGGSWELGASDCELGVEGGKTWMGCGSRTDRTRMKDV